MTRYTYYDERPCQMCGDSLKGKRGDAKYCSANCRKQGARRAAALNGYASDIASRIRGLEPYFHDKEQAGRVRGVLQELAAQIQNMLSVAAASGTDRAAAPSVTHRHGTDNSGQSDV